jgi:hypothetical protein
MVARAFLAVAVVLMAASGAAAMSACNAFAKNGDPCGDYASVCCGGLGAGGAPAECVGEKILQTPLKDGSFQVKWTPGTCVAPKAATPQAKAPKAAAPPAPGSFCTRWVGAGGPCTLSGADAPATGMVCCEPGLERSYAAGAKVQVSACALKQAKDGSWVPAGCKRGSA